VLFSFADHTLDVGRRELRHREEPVAVEPQVFDLLVYLIENRERVVSKDDLIASVWGGRIVSDSTLTSRITAARHAIGDSGEAQRLIRTIPRKGLRFIGEVCDSITRPLASTVSASGPIPDAERATPASALDSEPGGGVPRPARRASIAVMPFADLSPVIASRGGLADALVFDVISRLAKLRVLFVIAQGTVFALNERRIGPQDASRLLNVDYVVSGSVRRSDLRLSVSVELMEVGTGRLVWTDEFERPADDALQVLDEIGDRIVASIASEVETAERNRAFLKPPLSLDAWDAYHRGLWHMYRFNKADNDQAQHFFEMSIRLDPTFSRAYAGLSFAHWQNAFQGWAERPLETERAYAAAGQSLMADDRDPAAHWAMGRAQWLRGRQDESITELEQSIGLSPNFAQGHYSLAFVQCLSGDPAAAVAASDHSRSLSPFDPMLFAMLGVRCLALARLGRYEEAAEWGIRAAGRPNAHPHIHALAALSLALAGRLQEGQEYLASVRARLPRYSFADFAAAFHPAPDAEALLRNAAQRIGMPV
jgi:DNA-binding winged helix-turn-helix (wHTH) protein/tetratricopeptide (TPR) repeat protein